MVFCFFTKIFKSRKYTINDESDVYQPASPGVVFLKEDRSTPRLVQTRAALSPLLWRYIFPRSPSHPIDFDDDQDQEIASRQSCTRVSTTSSAGYCSGSDGSGSARLGAASDRGASPAEIAHYEPPVAVVSPAVDARSSIWGEPDFTPEPAEPSRPHIVHNNPPVTPFRSSFARHENRKRSLRRMPSAPVSGTVRQMVQFFESDSDRVQIPRRLDKVPPEFMRSCPQMESTPTPVRIPREVHQTHSDLARGVTNSSERCIRCHISYQTPASRRSIV